MNCTDPPLTTIRQPIDAMGQAAVALLASQVAGHVVPADEMLFEPELVVRGSTGPVRSRDSGDRRGAPPSTRGSPRSRAWGPRGRRGAQRAPGRAEGQLHTRRGAR